MFDARHHLTLIDGSGMAHRAWAMAPRRSRASDGAEVGAAGLFAMMLAKLVRQMGAGRRPPTHLAVFFDPPREDTWRRALCARYKANRDDRDPVFEAQIALMRRACAAAGIAEATLPRHEADDVIAGYALRAHAGGAFVSMISGDKDLLQLVRPGLVQLEPQRGIWFDVAAVTEKFGVAPDRVAHFLALAGDTADGIPGARGIGPVIARRLLAANGSIEHLLANLDAVTPPRVRMILEASGDDLRMALRLTRLDDPDMPAPLTPDAMKFPGAASADAALRAIRAADFAEA